MQRETPTKLVLLGVGAGTAAGLVVVLLVWLFLPRGATPAGLAKDGQVSEEPETEAATGKPDATPAGTEFSKKEAGPAPAAPKVRTEDQAEIYEKLKKIGLALHVHYDNFRTFAPPMAAPGDVKVTRLAWRPVAQRTLDDQGVAAVCARPTCRALFRFCQRAARRGVGCESRIEAAETDADAD